MKMILILGLAGVCLGIARYRHQESVTSNVIKQFQYSPLSSMKFFVFIDEKNEHPEILIKSLDRFLYQATKLSTDKKISLSVVYSKNTPEVIKKNIEALEDQYPSIYQTESVEKLLNEEKNLEIPRFITENPDEDLSQKFLKILLLKASEQAVFITSADIFPLSFEPMIGKNHLNNALHKVKSLNHGVVFCQMYSAPAIIGSKEIFFIDQKFLLSCFPGLQVKILQGLALERLHHASAIFKHALLIKQEDLSFEEYQSSLQECLVSYNKNPSLFLGAQALKQWAVGDIFYDQMAIEYKALSVLQQLGSWTDTSQNRLINKGCWSANVVRRFLQTEEISSLIAAIIIAQDYEVATYKELEQLKLQMLFKLYEQYRPQLSNDGLFILHDICRGSEIETRYSSKIPS